MPSRSKLAVRDPAFAPMLATLGAAPFGPAHATEWKFDGQRATVVVERGAVVVFTRNGMEVTRTFPELQSIAAAVGDRRMVLDGEIVALDTEGRPSFTRLQRRWPQQRRPSAELLREVPCRVMAFDVLRLDDRDTTALPYIERRELLDDVMVAKSRVLTVPAALHDVDPADALEAAALHGMEGIVVKRLDSPYRPGQRSPDWTKVPVRATCELLIAGYWCAGGPGGRSCVGSLLVAGYDPDGDLVAIGQVGTGFSATTAGGCSTSCSRSGAPPHPSPTASSCPACGSWNRATSPRSPTANTFRAAGCGTPHSRDAARWRTSRRSTSRTAHSRLLAAHAGGECARSGLISCSARRGSCAIKRIRCIGIRAFCRFQ